jgi:hypothetical protein
MNEYLRVLLGPLTGLVLGTVIVPLLVRIYRLHQEHQRMVKRQLFEHTEVILAGEFDGQVQTDNLGGFLTTLFGERLFGQIVHWNDKPSPSLINPPSDFQADHLRAILRAHVSPFLLQSKRIDCYFDRLAEYGTPSYKFAKFVACLVRPDACMLDSHDCPRVLVIEEAALRRVFENADVKPQYPTKDGKTWLETIRLVGEKYFSHGHPSIEVLEIPISKE